MNQFIHALWQTNIELSLLLLLILCARYAVRKTTRNYNAYLLWMSIPAGLLIAMLVAQIDFSGPPVLVVSQMVNSYVVQPVVVIDSVGYAAYLGYLWLLVAAVLLLRLILQHRQLRQDLRRISLPQLLQLQSAYPIIAIDKTNFSPAVYGFIQPTIYFPLQLVEKLSPQQISLIIQHEEHHIKQQHLWLNLAWDIVVCVMWFNPLMYISRQSFRHDQELFCDYLVLHKSGRESQNSYGHALLSTVSATHSVSLLCSWKTFNQLEERIMNIKKPASFRSKILLSACGIFIVAATSLYAASASEPQDNKPAKKVVYKVVHKAGAEHEGSHKKIKIMKDGLTFVEEDGKRYVVEGDEKRAMNDAEREMYEQLIEQTKNEFAYSTKFEDGEHHKQIKIIQGNGDGALSNEEMKIIVEELHGVELELDLHQNEFDKAEHELERALKDIEAAHAQDEISATALANARSQIEANRESLAQERERMRMSLEHTRQEIERLRAETLESK